MPLEVLIDLNMRTAGNGTVVGFEDVVRPQSGELPPVMLLDTVVVREEETGLRGTGTIMSIDPAKELIYLDVDWSSLALSHPEPIPPTQVRKWPAAVTRGTWATPLADAVYGVGRGVLHPLIVEAIQSDLNVTVLSGRAASSGAHNMVTTR